MKKWKCFRSINGNTGTSDRPPENEHTRCDINCHGYVPHVGHPKLCWRESDIGSYDRADCVCVEVEDA